LSVANQSIHIAAQYNSFNGRDVTGLHIKLMTQRNKNDMAAMQRFSLMPDFGAIALHCSKGRSFARHVAACAAVQHRTDAG
jgi:hypothetical protein